MPKHRRTKTKSVKTDSAQLELGDQPRLNVATTADAGAVPASQGEGDFALPPRRLGSRLRNWLKALAFLPFAWVLTAALLHTFKTAHSRGMRVTLWKSHEFLMFGLGAGLWLVIAAVCFLIWKRPRPVRVYVFGHELTHWLVAQICGGRIKEFHVGAEGGHIVTDKYNFFIALAPYLWPFYSVPVLAAWGVCSFFREVPYLREFFLAAFGFTWMFHLTFTGWVLPQGQSDLHEPGRFFSAVLIYLGNALVFGIALAVFAPEVTLLGYLRELKTCAYEFYHGVGDGVEWGVHFLAGLWRRAGT